MQHDDQRSGDAQQASQRAKDVEPLLQQMVREHRTAPEAPLSTQSLDLATAMQIEGIPSESTAASARSMSVKYQAKLTSLKSMQHQHGGPASEVVVQMADSVVGALSK